MKVICVNDDLTYNSYHIKKGRIYDANLISYGNSGEKRWTIESHIGSVYYYYRFKPILLSVNIRVL